MIKIIKDGISTGGITAPSGFLSSGIHCGLKKDGKLDMGLIYSKVPAKAAAVFTNNQVKAAPIVVSKKHIKNNISAVIINTKYANACTGVKGLRDAMEMCNITAAKLGIKPGEVLVASTGIIGQMLPMQKIKNGIEMAVQNLSKNSAKKTACAIMTTDTFHKEIAIQIKIGNKPVRIAGIAKGAGMICPDMATLLAFITTDANIEKNLLSKVFKNCISRSFNMITVDGDTSTNDFACILANGTAGNKPLSSKSKDLYIFEAGICYVLGCLARMVARDGEGASKFIEISVIGAKSEKQAEVVGKTVANSNLVKTAVFGRDANWGRIMAAIGRSKTTINPSKISIKLGNIAVAKDGCPKSFSESKAKRYLSGKNIIIEINLNMGYYQARVWTCDLTDRYVYINADYRS